jgi:acetate kinase
MRDVLAAEHEGEPAAMLAVAVYLHRLRAGIAAMAAAAGGVDVLVFTGGVGERAGSIRQRAVDGLAFLGLAVDQSANNAADGDSDISGDDSSGRVLVITAREDLEIVRQTRAALG